MEEPTNKKEPKKGECPERAIMCPEDWSDPEQRKVIGEYHKGQPEDPASLDSEVKAFEGVWSAQGRPKLSGEYHKEGAPFMGWSEQGTSSMPPSAKTPEDYHKMLKEKGVPERPLDEGTKTIDIGRNIDLGTVEVISYALFRAIFGLGVRIPIKREGMVDMEMIVRGKDIILNTNQFYFVMPELSVWRVIYTHQGVPVMEFGRGVKKGLKVHRVQALRLALSLWKESKKSERERARLRSAEAESTEEKVAE